MKKKIGFFPLPEYHKPRPWIIKERDVTPRGVLQGTTGSLRRTRGTPVNKLCSLFFLCLFLMSGFCFSDDIEARFGKERTLLYDVFFNGIPTGKIECNYLGKRGVPDGREK